MKRILTTTATMLLAAALLNGCAVGASPAVADRVVDGGRQARSFAGELSRLEDAIRADPRGSDALFLGGVLVLCLNAGGEG